jgi:rSAM/selenodomain-associated transferase 1
VKKGLILFVRNPVLGQVKTRLARTLGNEQALRIYRHLLAYTHSITKELDCDKFVFYADAVTDHDLWENDQYHKRLQSGAELGQRMQHAFTALFQAGYERVIIIGSDCLELTAEIIQKGFLQLEEKDVVIGPSLDGGYYLLGMKHLRPALFQGKTWSSASVLADTIADCLEHTLSHSLLPQLNDIDEEKDVPENLLKS